MKPAFAAAAYGLPPIVNTVIAIGIFVATLLLIMLRPKKLNEALTALVGAALMLLAGIVSPLRALKTLLGDWNIFLFFLGMMTLSALAERAGFFDWLAARAAVLANGSTRRLYLNVFLLGALITAFLSNDATALILTPVVYTLVTRLRVSAMPFMFACTFIADTASFLLPVSNPINIIILSSFRLGLLDFLRLLLLPSILAISINAGMFFWLFRRQIIGRFEIKRLGTPTAAIRHRPYFRYVCIVLGLVAIAYVAVSLLQGPLSLVAIGGALALLLGALRWKQVEWKGLGKEISWPIFGFIAGMFIVVQGIESIGLTQHIGQFLTSIAGSNALAATFVGTAGAAVGSNLINNLPMALVLVSTIGALSSVSPNVRLAFIATAMFGCDLGPNLTTVGSLATVLWLLLLRRRGMEVSSLDYFKLGIIVTPIMLIVGAFAIWLSVQVF
ncbi:MAG TPA: ArsB/NhaD family transporter [Ktedonobacterales bacterium]